MATRFARKKAPVVVLKSGEIEARSRRALKSNILAVKILANLVKSSLGPRGMNKLIVDTLEKITITNDGATVLKKIEVEHPAAKMLVDAAKAVEAEVGDGTTSVVVLTSALLERGLELVNKGFHPIIIAEGFKNATSKALEIMDGLAIDIDDSDSSWLYKVALTSISSKITGGYGDFIARIVVEAADQIKRRSKEGFTLDVENVEIRKKAGGSIYETKLIDGFIIDKGIAHPAMPKKVKNAKIALIKTPLEIKKPTMTAKIRIEDPNLMRSFIESENQMLMEIVDKMASKGANVVFCQKAIDEKCQYLLAKKGILAVRGVRATDMEKISMAVGGRIVSHIDDLSSSDLGEADLVEERKVGEDRWVFIEGCKNPKSVTVLVRGGNERILDEIERIIRNGLNVVRDTLLKPKVVAGGGAIEAELAMRVRDWALSLPGREQIVASKYAEALESIPINLAKNSGMNPIDVETKLRHKHRSGNIWSGIDSFNRKVEDMITKDVIEPVLVKEQVLKSATEVASAILRINLILATSMEAIARKHEKEAKRFME